MPRVIYENMPDKEILRHIAEAYATRCNWESFEKDFGTQQVGVMPAWTRRDQGDYARRGLSIIAKRKSERQDILRCFKTACYYLGGGLLGLAFFMVMAWFPAIMCVLFNGSQQTCGL